MGNLESYYHNRHLQLQLAIEEAEKWSDSIEKRQIICLLEAEKDEVAIESQRIQRALDAR